MNTHETETPATVRAAIERETVAGAKMILPFVVIIETGNHIAHIADGNIRRIKVEEFTTFVTDCLEGNRPWMPFNGQDRLYTLDKMKELLETWKGRAIPNKDSIGDVSITAIAEFYACAMSNYDVLIYTLDEGLRAYSPSERANELLNVPAPPRRKKN
ncbi:MAG: hypothetical protein JNM36_19760 [Chitinophagales bacterium]|nr:hypothetical protein [Chitinophagales bacterium]